jgi:hypothetical protein
MANDSETYLKTISILQERICVLEKMLNKKVLQGKDEIMKTYNMTEYKFKKWVKAGMPVLIVDGTCYAHRDNIDEYFKSATRVNSSKVPDANM